MTDHSSHVQSLLPPVYLWGPNDEGKDTYVCTRSFFYDRKIPNENLFWKSRHTIRYKNYTKHLRPGISLNLLTSSPRSSHFDLPELHSLWRYSFSSSSVKLKTLLFKYACVLHVPILLAEKEKKRKWTRKKGKIQSVLVTWQVGDRIRGAKTRGKNFLPSFYLSRLGGRPLEFIS